MDRQPKATVSAKPPFYPRPGAMPEYLAGRQDERKVLLEMARSLSEGEVPRSNIILTAPRGFGKTTLLGLAAQRLVQQASQEAREKDRADLSSLDGWRKAGQRMFQKGKPPAKACSFNASQVMDIPSLMAVALGRKASAAVTEHASKSRSAKGGFGFPVLGAEAGGDATRTEGRTIQHPPMGIAEWTEAWAEKCARSPTLLLLDEAHSLPSVAPPGGAPADSVAAVLFNAVQALQNSGAPLCLVLAGTPDMRDNLSKAKATFWSRCAPDCILDLPSLTLEESLSSLRVPLERMGVEASPDALHRMAEDAQGYPHFLQMWGSAAFLSMRDANSTTLRLEHVAAAADQIDAARQAHYADQLSELEDVDAGKASPIPAFVALSALVLASPRGRAFPRQASEAVARGIRFACHHKGASMDIHVLEKTTKSILRHARHFGLVRFRQEAKNSWCVPAIPSLLSHIIENADWRGPDLSPLIEDARELARQAPA